MGRIDGEHLEHPSSTLGHKFLQWGFEVADLYLQQWLRLQEFCLKRRLLPIVSSFGQIHRQSNLSHWANKSYDWSVRIGLIDPNYHIFDGTDDTKNCTSLDEIIWTYNAGIALYGAAVLYNYTNGSALWAERTDGLLNATANFFSPYENSSNIMYEPACETVNTCNNDEYSFKGYLSRFMWDTTLLAPFTTDAITFLLTPSAQAAAAACSGGTDHATCGQKWYVGGYDGKFGVGQQMSALETIQGLLIGGSVPPLHSDQVHLMAAPTPSQAPVPTQSRRSPTQTAAAASMKVGRLNWSWGLATIVVLVNMGLGSSY